MKEVNEIDKDIAKKIAMKIESFNLEKIGIEDIQDNVENELMAYNLRKTAKAYIRYRYKRELVRQGNTTDKTIMELLNGNSEYWNTENSNKNPKVVTTQRDYIAGATSTDIARRFLLPKDVIEAHDKGIIHFHDMDYMAQNALNNCFSGDTKLITNLGVKRFDEFYDGDIIQVKDKDGVWRSATVKKYGKQKMYDITFKTPKMKKTITCTDNHRWILKDGSVTTNLNVGDELYLLNDSRVNIDQENLEECRAFAFGFIIGDGCDITNSIGVTARLCGDKIKYKDIFTKAGYQISKINNSDDINVYNKKEYSKQAFLNNFSWRVISLKQKIALFNGYYAADGKRNANEISTSDKRIALMIEEISSLAGYYVSSTKEEIRNTNLKKDAYLKTYHFVVSQPSNLAWKVESITPHFNIKYKDNRRKNSFRISNTPIVAWCVEEPITHSFTLDGGVVTGNCCLINLDDMLQNGTVINGVKIDPQHRLLTATTVSTQIITAVASSQYGGTTITLTHLAPYVRMSYENYLKDVIYELKDFDIPQDEIKKITLKRLKKEIKDAVQTFNYQINSMSTTNGQAPFLSVCMYLNENPEYTQEVALLIEEFLNQRMLGMKNEKGIYVTPAFPKLLYVLDENNIHEDSKYWYLTELAAKCTAKRMVPDYISAKIMKEIKGDVYPCMGCVDGQEIITYKFHEFLFVESFERMWERLSSLFTIKTQPNGQDWYMDVKNISIYDKKNGFVKIQRIIRNMSKNWVKVKMTNGRQLLCTDDHPLPTQRGRVFAKDLQRNDVITINHNQYSENIKHIDSDLAWAYGVLLCDSSYSSSVIASFAFNDEDDIIDNLIKTITKHYGIEASIIERHRGKKGDYKDVSFKKAAKLRYKLISMFEGIIKNERHIPNEVFKWDRNARLSFLAGIIDADGYLNSNRKITRVQIGSVNKELALQQMALAQSLNMPAYVYENHYDTKDKLKIRYRVEFIPTTELVSLLKCQKKINHFENNEKTNYSSSEKEVAYVNEVVNIDRVDYSYDVTTDSDYFDVSGIYSHNCRSFLTPDRIKGNPAKAINYHQDIGKYYGRFNVGVVTINLVDVALSSKRNFDKFWELLEERCELCHKGLKVRIKRLEEAVSDVAPILWQHGAFARLESGKKIKPLIHGGYATASLGYGGLYECVKYMTNHSHTDNDVGEKFALEVMQKLNDMCNKWKTEEDIDYSLYGTPMESTTYKFARCLQDRFGIIEDVTDHDYITNSYHVNVREKIDPFSKLKLEAEFQKLSPGGAISYLETANLQNNVEAVLEVIKFIYNNIMYAELNTKSDYCQKCGYDGELLIDENMEWYCPNCGNRDQTKMNVARRTCGYIGSHFWNYGRTEEIKERYVHLGSDD